MRILSLLPAATDIVAALDASDEVVGITHECDDPRPATPCPRVTSTSIIDGSAADVDAAVRALSSEGDALYHLDADAIRTLAPDVILTQAVCDVCAVREADVRALADQIPPRPRVVTLGARTLDGVLAEIETVATAIGRRERGQALRAALDDRLRTIHDRLRAAAAPRPTVAVIEWTDPLFAAGHWVPDMIRRAGGRDVLGSSGAHSAQVTAAQVAATDPAVVIVAPCGYSAPRAATALNSLLADPAWAWAASRPAWALDANVLTSRPGPQLVRGVEVLAALLHPQLFPAPAARDACAPQGPVTSPT
jgi:iron complex transport system substrate-binding protein